MYTLPSMIRSKSLIVVVAVALRNLVLPKGAWNKNDYSDWKRQHHRPIYLLTTTSTTKYVADKKCCKLCINLDLFILKKHHTTLFYYFLRWNIALCQSSSSFGEKVFKKYKNSGDTKWTINFLSNKLCYKLNWFIGDTLYFIVIFHRSMSTFLYDVATMYILLCKPWEISKFLPFFSKLTENFS